MSQFSEPRVGCGAAVIRDERILLVRRLREPEAGCWGIAGGKIDLFETAVDAAARELMEEVGITAASLEWLCFVDQIDREAGSHWVAPIFLVQQFDGTPRLMEPEKHAALDWFALDALPEPLTAAAKGAVAAWQARDPSR